MLSVVFTGIWLGRVLMRAKGKKTENILPVRSYRMRDLVPKAGKSSCPLPPKAKRLSARYALHTARITPGRQPMCPDRVPVKAYIFNSVLPRRARAKRKVRKKCDLITSMTISYRIPGIRIYDTWYVRVIWRRKKEKDIERSCKCKKKRSLEKRSTA